MTYTVGALARLAKVSVRTLHHYDEIGLVRPTGRSHSGYRLYEVGDLERLQQVLFYRALDFGLGEIQEMLDAPTFDRRKALISQRELLLEKAERARALVALVDKSLAALEEKETKMIAEEMFEGFDPADYADEVMTKWGKTVAYAESKKKTSRYTKEDWKEMGVQAETNVAEFVSALEAGVAASDPRAMDLAEHHRLHLERWFFACPPAFHVGLGEMYVQDARFAAHYDSRKSGLAAYIAEAIRANAKRSTA
ncbi:MAG: MerR family transcriptional regulator [Polyangiaceae bacterium]